jgi:probable rRNA maturation factor
LNENRELTIEFADEQSAVGVDFPRLRLAVERILEEADVRRAEVSVAVVDDRAIRELNDRYLRHDYATDVLSFVLERSDERLEGQIIVSADTARREAARYGWPPENELLLYVMHGALHLVGYEDGTPAARIEMRRKEKEALGRFGLEPRWKARDKTS